VNANQVCTRLKSLLSEVMSVNCKENFLFVRATGQLFLINFFQLFALKVTVAVKKLIGQIIISTRGGNDEHVCVCFRKKTILHVLFILHSQPGSFLTSENSD
jgi:hypothetical protein